MIAVSVADFCFMFVSFVSWTRFERFPSAGFPMDCYLQVPLSCTVLHLQENKRPKTPDTDEKAGP